MDTPIYFQHLIETSVGAKYYIYNIHIKQIKITIFCAVLAYCIKFVQLLRNKLPWQRLKGAPFSPVFTGVFPHIRSPAKLSYYSFAAFLATFFLFLFCVQSQNSRLECELRIINNALDACVENTRRK